LSDQFVKKAIISADIKEKDLELFKDGTNTALTLGAAKYADIVIMGSAKLDKKVIEEVKPSKVKKVVPFEETWTDDVTSLLDLYKSLTES